MMRKADQVEGGSSNHVKIERQTSSYTVAVPLVEYLIITKFSIKNNVNFVFFISSILQSCFYLNYRSSLHTLTLLKLHKSISSIL